MKTGADLEQAGDASFDPDIAVGRAGDARAGRCGGRRRLVARGRRPLASRGGLTESACACTRPRTREGREDDLEVGRAFATAMSTRSSTPSVCLRARRHCCRSRCLRPCIVVASTTLARRARSTSSTGRCVRSREAHMRLCRRAATPRWTSCRSVPGRVPLRTTSPDPLRGQPASVRASAAGW